MKTGDNAIDDLSTFFQGWRVEAIQLEPRRGEGAVSCASFRSHRILRLQAGSAYALRGALQSTSACVLLSGSERAAIRMLGRSLRANDLVFAGPGASLDLFVPSGAVLSLLVAKSRPQISRRAPRVCNGATVDDKASLARYLRQPEAYRENIDTTLANHLRHAVATSSREPPDHDASTVRVAAVVCACRLVDERLPEPVTLSDLARHCGVAERTLEYGFRQVYDTTPLTFIRSLRLTRSRMALLRAPAAASISQTANDFGFTHMGQYSRDYRRLFGETPSMTLALGRYLRTARG